MFFKTRKITEVEKLDVILEYLENEQTRWQDVASRDEPTLKADARLMYLEEQLALTDARRAVEAINPHKK